MARNLRVELKHGRSCLDLIRQFKRLCDEIGIVYAVKQRARYEKPSDKRRRKKRQAELQRRYAEQEKKNLANKNNTKKYDYEF